VLGKHAVALRANERPGWQIDLVFLLVGLSAFLILALYQIELPGLHTDEAMEVLPAMQLLRGQPVECYKDVCLDLFGLRLPVMIYEYIAAVNAYLVLPFFALLGINVPALRALPIAQSAVALVFVYLFAREFLNRRIAVVALFLLAVNPSFVFWSRQGVFVTIVTIPLSMIGLWALWRWIRRCQAIYLYLAALLFGLGVSAKLLSWWVIAGIGGAAALLNLDRVRNCVRQRSLTPLGLPLSWKQIAIAALLFLVGLAPVIVFNVKTGSTIHYVRDNLFGSSYYDIDNSRVGENLRERIKELGSVINGETFFYLAGKPYASWRYRSVFLFAVGTLLFSVLLRRTDASGGTTQAVEPLAAWSTFAVIVLSSYLILRFVDLETRQWYGWTLALAPPAALVGTWVHARRTGSRATPRTEWRIALKLLGLGLVAAIFFIFFVYLSWKLAKWQSPQLYVTAVLALLLAPWLSARQEAKTVWFPLLVLAIALVGSAFTPTGLLFTHLAILMPWPILVVATAVDLVARRSGLDRLNLSRLRGGDTPKSRAWATAASLGTLIVLALTGMLVYDDLRVDIAYHRDLAVIGGIADHTSASYNLVNYLQQEEITQTAAMDWGIQDVVQFLSEGQLNPPQLSSYEDPQQEDAAFSLRVQEQLENPETVYIFHVGAVFENRWETFQELVLQTGRTPVEIKVIHDRAAMPIYRLVRVPADTD
jgi:4-amino-4-deoxy-L-arabinose transferase-like glycosyltransferase